MMSIRQFDKLVFVGHGFKKSPKDRTETQIVLNDADSINSVAMLLNMYLISKNMPIPDIKVKHPALKDKKLVSIGIDFKTNSLYCYVE